MKMEYIGIENPAYKTRILDVGILDYKQPVLEYKVVIQGIAIDRQANKKQQ